MKRLVLIADEPEALRVVRLALRQTAGFRVVATLDGRTSAQSRLETLAPDVIVIDEMCQRSNALARIREALAAANGHPVVVLARSLDPSFVGHGLEAGADAMICRTLPPATIGTLLREVVAGNVVHSPRAGTRAGSVDAPPRLRVVARQEAPEARTIA